MYMYVCFYVGRTDATDQTADSKSTEQNKQVWLKAACELFADIQPVS